MEHTLDFLDDPEAFLAAASELLAASPVESTVVASVTARMSAVRPADRGVPDGIPLWWLVVRDHEGRVVGAGMRTAPFPPHPPYLLSMPEDAARSLARVLHERGETVTRVNGASLAAEAFARKTAALDRRSARVAERLRLYEVREPVPPAVPDGRLVPARPEHVEVVVSWFDAFAVDAAEQAGEPDPHPAPIETAESALARIESGEIWLWEAPDGTPVHLTAFNPPSFGVARVGPVYTPREHRGCGYAGAAVAEVSRRLLADGARVCLFADLANPVSGALYERLGYRPVVDMANLIIE